MAKTRIDPMRVMALVTKIRDSYVQTAKNLEDQRTIMHMVGETDTEPIDDCIEYFKKKIEHGKKEDS